MESNQRKFKNSFLKRLGIGGMGLCALLCALPVIGAALGIGAFTAAAAYFEKIGAAVLILSIGLLGYWLFKKKRLAEASAPACEMDREC